MGQSQMPSRGAANLQRSVAGCGMPTQRQQDTTIDDAHPASPDRPRLSGRGGRAGRLPARRRRQGLHRCVRRRGGVLPRPWRIPDVLAAMHAQLDRLAFAHTSFFTSQVAEELADDLVAHAPAGIGHVFYVSGGSEAVEAALKLARQYFVERGEPQRRYVIARRQSYHGITLGALAIGGRARAARAVRAAPVRDASRLAGLRVSRPPRRRDAGGLRRSASPQELEAKIAELGAENVIGFVAETVVGATLGAVPAVPGYFRRVREICDRHGILLILDEVMCGMGRTGTLHACEQEGISPDLIAIAKGLGGGFAPIGALLMQEKVFEAIAQRLRRVPAQPHLHGPSARLRGGAGGAAGDPPRRPSGQRAPAGRLSGAPAQGAVRQPPVRRRRARPRPVSGPRAGRRPRHQGGVRPEAAAACAGEAARRWRAA